MNFLNILNICYDNIAQIEFIPWWKFIKQYLHKILSYHFLIINIVIFLFLNPKTQISNSEHKQNIIKLCVYDLPLIMSGIYSLLIHRPDEIVQNWSILIIGALLASLSHHQIKKKIDTILREWLYLFLDSGIIESKIWFKKKLMLLLIKKQFAFWIFISFIIELFIITFITQDFLLSNGKITRINQIPSYQDYRYFKRIFSIVARILSVLWYLQTNINVDFLRTILFSQNKGKTTKKNIKNNIPNKTLTYFRLIKKNHIINQNIIFIYGLNGSGKTTMLNRLKDNNTYRQYKITRHPLNCFYNLSKFNNLDWCYFLLKHENKNFFDLILTQYSQGEKFKICLNELIFKQTKAKIIIMDEQWNNINYSFQKYILSNIPHNMLLILTFNYNTKKYNEEQFSQFKDKIYNIILK